MVGHLELILAEDDLSMFAKALKTYTDNDFYKVINQQMWRLDYKSLQHYLSALLENLTQEQD